MKALKQTCVIFLSLIMLAACTQHSENSEKILEHSGSSSASLTSFEKSQAGEEQLIRRLQSIISEMDSVGDTVIVITTSEETGKEVDVSITTEKDKQLTDEEKEGIINIIASSVGDLEADNIHITEN